VTIYLTVDDFKLRTVAPAGYVDAVDILQPGWTAAQIEMVSRWIDARLSKRYATPWLEVPEIVKAWVVRIVTLKLFLRRGVDPTDDQFAEIRKDAEDAQSEVKEAADAATNNFDLPLRNDQSGSGIVYGSARVYSEQSPYVWQDRQVDIANQEDRNRGGSS
jgi:phage gp36-like protein